MKEKRSGLVWIISLAIFAIGPVVLLVIFANKPKSMCDLIEQHLDEIACERGELRLSSSAMDEVQKENGILYYLDAENNLMQRKDGKDECLIKGVLSFLVDEQDIFYIKTDEKSRGIYCRKQGGKEETQVVPEDVCMFAMGSGQNYACTENRLLRFDTQWKEESSYSFQKQFKSLYGWNCSYAYGTEFLVFFTSEGDLYVYSLLENKMEQWEVPIQQKATQNEVVTDLAEREGELYYMTCQYTPSDHGTSDDLVECRENGIYRMDFKTKKLEKVSDSCGFMLLNLEDDLYVSNSGFIFQKLTKCEWIKK